MDKGVYIDIETGSRILSEIRSNGRNIADNSLRLMTLTDKVDDVKEDTRAISEVIQNMQDGVATLLDLNLQMRDNLKEQREANQEIKSMFNDLLANGKLIRRDIDSIKEVLDDSTVVLYDGLKVM